MTDTSREAVERLAAQLDAAGSHYGLPMERTAAEAASTLRALLLRAETAEAVLRRVELHAPGMAREYAARRVD